MLANLLEHLPPVARDEAFQTLVEAEQVKIERIVSHGHASPPGFWYDQPRHEWVLVLRGAARLAFEDRTVELRAGDCTEIPAGRRHRVEWTAPGEPTIWLAVHYEGGR